MLKSLLSNARNDELISSYRTEIFLPHCSELQVFYRIFSDFYKENFGVRNFSSFFYVLDCWKYLLSNARNHNFFQAIEFKIFYQVAMRFKFLI